MPSSSFSDRISDLANLQAEQALLGCILLNNDELGSISSHLSAEDFFLEEHKTIYKSMCSLGEIGSGIDLITLGASLREKGHLEQVGGNSYLLGLTNSVAVAVMARSYADIIKKLSLKRQCIALGSEIMAQGYDPSSDPLEMIEGTEEKLFDLVSRSGQKTSLSLKDALTKYVDQIEEESNGEGIKETMTGLPDLDRCLGGLRPGSMTILAARPSMGKSSLSLSIALHSCRRYHSKIGLFSLEMGIEEILLRLLSMETGIDSQKISHGLLDDHEWEKVIQGMSDLSRHKIDIDDSAFLSPSSLRHSARRMSLKMNGLDLLIIDYVQLMQVGKASKDDALGNRVAELNLVSRSIKALARELEVPVLALAQVNRTVDRMSSKEPQLSDIKDSGSFEQDADKVIMLVREEVYNPETEKKNQADLYIKKNRQGAVGLVHLFFNPKLTLFSSLG